MKDKIKYRRQGQGRRPSHGSRKRLHLTGATLEALGDNGSLILKAGNNIHLDTDTLEAKQDMTENSDNYIHFLRQINYMVKLDGLNYILK